MTVNMDKQVQKLVYSKEKSKVNTFNKQRNSNTRGTQQKIQ